MRVAFILPGLHRIQRGAEVAFESISYHLSQYPDVEVTLFGSGHPKANDPYQFIHVSNVDRRHFDKLPKLPLFRTAYTYEEFTFALNLWPLYKPKNFDITVTCSYPFINWILMRRGGLNRPKHIFVTQNSDHPAIANQSEYSYFDCDGLVCTNPDYFERNKRQWNCTLITNGVDIDKFYPSQGVRQAFDLPEHVPLVLMVSALEPSKRIDVGIQAVSQIDGAHLIVCGDGAERDNLRKLGDRLMPSRFHLRKLKHQQMPEIYQVSDVFLHLSLDEPFGNVYLEAMASNLPTVAHDRDITEWILEDTASLVDTTNIDDVTRILKSLLKKRSQFRSHKPRKMAEIRFSWEEVSQKYYRFMHAIYSR